MKDLVLQIEVDFTYKQIFNRWATSNYVTFGQCQCDVVL